MAILELLLDLIYGISQIFAHAKNKRAQKIAWISIILLVIILLILIVFLIIQ